MARNNEKRSPEPGNPVVRGTPDQRLGWLRAQLEEGERLVSLVSRLLTAEAFDEWVTTTEVMVEWSFGSTSSMVTKFQSAGAYSRIFVVGEPDYRSADQKEAEARKERAQEITAKLAILRSCVKVVEAEMAATRTEKPGQSTPRPVQADERRGQSEQVRTESSTQPSRKTGKLYGDRWQTVRSLGEGGQAWTYVVVDANNNDKIEYALKRLKNTNRLSRFRQEIEAVRLLDHPNVVRIVDVNMEDPNPYFVSEYHAGGNLTMMGERLGRDWGYAFGIFFGICRGIAVAHEAGIVHRDIKPENILLDASRKTAIVADFGICYIEGSERHTLTQEQVGARFFMAPELEDGRAESVSARSDVYSLGKLLHWMLSGGKLFAREKHRVSSYDLVQLHGAPPMEHINRVLDEVIVDDPQRRLPSASALMDRMKPAVRAVLHDRNAPSSSLRQPCTYCGHGEYQAVARDNNSARNFGVNTIGNPDWRILACTTCGHVQMFRLDYATRRDWWTT